MALAVHAQIINTLCVPTKENPTPDPEEGALDRFVAACSDGDLKACDVMSLVAEMLESPNWRTQHQALRVYSELLRSEEVGEDYVDYIDEHSAALDALVQHSPSIDVRWQSLVVLDLLYHEAEVEAENQGHSPHEALFSKLIESTNPTDIDCTNYKGASMLWRAAIQGYEDCTRMLLRMGASLDLACSIDGSAPIMPASVRGHDGVVRLLLDAKASAGVKDDDGFSPLYAASSEGLVDVVRLLLTGGAPVDATNREGLTAAFIACFCDRESIVRLLLEHGASANASDCDGESALHVAIRKNNEQTFRLLLAHKASVNAAKTNGTTPLYLAAQMLSTNMVQVLLERGAVADSVKIENGVAISTPLICAMHNGCDEVMTNILIDHGAAVEYEVDGILPIHKAAQCANEPVLEALIARKAAVDGIDRMDCTPLMHASEIGNESVCRLLLQHGANVNRSAAKVGWTTALIQASSRGHLPVVRLLMESGANAGAVCLLKEQNNAPATATSIASAWNHHETATWITAHHGYTPLHFATEAADYAGVCEILRSDAAFASQIKARAGPQEQFTPLALARHLRRTDALEEDRERIEQCLCKALSPWTLRANRLFPDAFRRAVITLFLCNSRMRVRARVFLPTDVWFVIISFCDRDAFYVPTSDAATVRRCLAPVFSGYVQTRPLLIPPGVPINPVYVRACRQV